MRTQKSLDEIFHRRAIFFCLQLARQEPPAERRVAERAGNKDFVAGTSRIAPHHTTPGLTNKRNRDRQLSRARNVATNYICGSFARRIAQPRVNSLERTR